MKQKVNKSEKLTIYKDQAAPLQAYWIVAFNSVKPMST